MEWENELMKMRKQIDTIDDEIIKLLNKRMQLCKEIGEIKRMRSIPIEDCKRENEILQKAGIFKSVFKEIISLCKDLEK
ncbi:MAG: chorismate mutase [Thermoprotei archaeon]|jgi:3-dehydroquinate dehydratase-1